MSIHDHLTFSWNFTSLCLSVTVFITQLPAVTSFVLNVTPFASIGTTHEKTLQQQSAPRTGLKLPSVFLPGLLKPFIQQPCWANPAPHHQPCIQCTGPGAGGPCKLQPIASCQQPQQISETSVAYQASSIFPTLISTSPAPAFISKDLAWYLQKKKIKKIAQFLQMQLVGRTAFEI